MKTISHFAASFILLASFGLPILASAACPAPYVEDNGQCYSVDSNNNFTRVLGVSPTGGAVSQTAPGNVNSSFLTFYKDLIVGTINNILVPVLIAIAFIVFLWGVYKYFIYGADNETERETGRQFVLWGVIGFVIITALWGLVNIVTGTLITGSGVNTNAPPPPRI